MTGYQHPAPFGLWAALLIAGAGMIFSGLWVFNSDPDPNPSRRNSASSASLISPPGSSATTTNWLVPAPNEMENEIKALLDRQTDAWNRGNMKEFMRTYWQSQFFTFSAGGQTYRGWDAAMERFRQSYPEGSMGNLRFDELEVYRLTEQWALVLGRWYLTGTARESEGNFSLVLRNTGDDWVIVHDHSSSLPAAEPPANTLNDGD